MLAGTAAAGASLRVGLLETDPHGVLAAAAGGRPRSLVVVGAGGSSAAGDLVAACAGRGSSVPVVTVGGPGLPGWVGPLDLVVAVSASGSSPETLAAVGEAARRGAHVVGVGCGGPLFDAVVDARGVVLGIGRPPEPTPARLLLWRLAAPVLLLAAELGLVEVTRGAVAAAADELDAVALACGPAAELGGNPAKDAALLCAEGIPLIWGTPGVPAAAARRFARQLAENAGVAALHGALPEVARTHARVLAGHWSDEGDLFRDRTGDAVARRPSLTLLREGECDRLSADLADTSASLARAAGIPTTELDAGEGNPLMRFVRLAGPLDFASVYCAVALGSDPAGTAAQLDPSLGSAVAAVTSPTYDRRSN
ncbi:MAG: hypothetical protein RLZ55_47 [Actinomycetota bacterium]